MKAMKIKKTNFKPPFFRGQIKDRMGSSYNLIKSSQAIS